MLHSINKTYELLSINIFKNITIAVYILLSATVLNSQKKLIDSLETKLSTHIQNDTTKVNLLNELALKYYRNDINKTIDLLTLSDRISRSINYPKGLAKSTYIKGITKVIQSDLDSSIFYFNKSSDLYRKTGDKKGIATCFNGKGVAYYYKGDYELSIEQYEHSLNIYTQLNDRKNMATNYMNLGSTYADIGDYTKAIALYNTALKTQKELHDESSIAKIFNNLGTIYDDLGNYPLALENYNKLLYYAENTGDSLAISKALNNIGIVYRKQNKYDKALKYYQRSLVIHERNKNIKSIAHVKNNIGIIYKHKKSYQIALNYLKESLEISRKIKDKDGVSRCLNNIGEVYIKSHNYNKALDYLAKAKELNLEIGDQLGLCNSCLGMANSYLELNQNQKALKYAQKGYKIAKELKSLNQHRDAQLILSSIYQKLNNYKEAFIHQQKYKLLDDSLLNKENIEKIISIEYEYKYKQKLDSANIRESKLTKTVKTTSKNLELSQRNSFIAIIIILLISIIFGAIIFILKLRNVNAKNQNIMIEQKLLRSQMTPHFIFNSLSVLQGMILNKEENRSISYLSKFSKLLRTILENSRHKTVILAKELDAINSYMALHNLDANPPYNFIVNIDKSVQVNNLQIPPMLIQPFIENAIEHAFVNSIDDRQIVIHLKFDNKVLTCTISDNGKGINTDKKQKNKNKKSLATAITSERIEMLSKHFKMKGSISIKDKNTIGQSGTLVTLIIPYKNNSIK